MHVNVMLEGAPTRGAVLLFLVVSIFAVLLSAGTAVFAVWNTVQYVNHSNQQWCHALSDFTTVKPPAANPKTQPGRVYEVRQYEDFLQLKKDFGC